jgi:hypothetical protein
MRVEPWPIFRRIVAIPRVRLLQRSPLAKGQSMRWSRRGAHLLVQIRLAVLEDGRPEAFWARVRPLPNAGTPGSHPYLTPHPTVCSTLVVFGPPAVKTPSLSQLGILDCTFLRGYAKNPKMFCCFIIEVGY